MASTGGLVVQLGRGYKPNKLGSVWIARIATTVGGTYMVAEDIDLPDDAAVTVENSGADNGTLANLVGIPAGAANGLLIGVGGQLAMFVLAEEVAASGGPVMGMVEGYYVDATCVIATTTKNARTALFPTTSENVSDTPPAVGSPAIARLAEQSVVGTALRKVHFCGFPGGFGVGPGT